MILFIRYSQLSELEKKQEKMMKEFETVITSFLLEMKEENELFLQKLQKQGEQKSKMEKLNQPSRSSTLEKEIRPPQIEQVKDVIEISGSKMFVSERSKPEKGEKIGTNEPPDPMETLLAQVQILQNEGLSIEEIAKKLNKGKTEIELLLKFRQKS
jgi:hypothetical protein